MPRIRFEISKGRLGNDPDVNDTRDGNGIFIVLNIAVNEYKVVKKKRKKEFEQTNTSWVRCVVFGKLADQVEEMELVQGDQVFVQGTMAQTEWENEDGEPRKGWDFVANTLFKHPEPIYDDEDDYADEDDYEEPPRRKRSNKKRSSSQNKNKKSSRSKKGKSRLKNSKSSRTNKRKKKGKSKKLTLSVKKQID